MDSAKIEAFLARIYVDEEARERFLVDPRGEAMLAGLNDEEASALERIDRVGLELTVDSLRIKRSKKASDSSAGRYRK